MKSTGHPDADLTPHGDTADELSFPDMPRLELDTLLAQLIERAQEVVSTQGRLRGLLRATQMITADLALPVVLRHVAAAARDLVGARYAALGVIAPAGHLSEFVHVGMPEDLVEEIGQLPQGKGLLGALIDDPVPIRLDRLGEDDRSTGFPPGHPPMDSFLGVPVRVREEVFGNLYLAESTRGAFSAEDEELATALAASAGVVIANARLYEAAQDRHRWLQASAMITSRLLSPDPVGSGRPLQLIAERCRDIANADLVTVVLPAEETAQDGAGRAGGSSADAGRARAGPVGPAAPRPPELRVEVAVGPGSQVEELVGRAIPLEASLAGRVFTSGQPLRVPNAYEETEAASAVWGAMDVGPVLVVPLKGSQRVHGVLTAARLRGCAAFSAEDLDMATGFATQASMAIELAEARVEQQRAAMFEERDRIAADLHDHVIQKLFATGLALQSITAGLAPGRGRDRVQTAITDLDDTIKQIRTSIFQLHRPSNSGGSDVRARLLEVVTTLTPVLGFEPSIQFDGVFENVLAESVVEDLLAVLREALTNIARHARARSVVVTATAGGGRLALEVIDDGCGIGQTTRRSGLSNLRHRAENHDGTLTVAGGEQSGTRLVWSVPIEGSMAGGYSPDTIGPGGRTDNCEINTGRTPGATVGISVFLLDDHEVARRGIAQLLETEDDITVVGEAGSVSQAMARIPALRPDVAILDVRLLDGDGVSVCRDIRSALTPPPACLMLTSYSDDEALFGAIMAGAAGYLLKQVAGVDLIGAVRTIAAGGSLLDPNATAAVLAKLRQGNEPVDPRFQSLSPQEQRILGLIAEGLTNRQIGAEMYLAEKTVKNYVSSLLHKLGFSRRTEAAVYETDRRSSKPSSS